MRPLYLAAATVLLVGCTVDSSVNESTTNQAVETHNRLASNRLASNRLASNRLASNRLASNRLASNQLAANALTAQILETEAGRDVYSYIVSCALPEDVTIEAVIAGTDPVADSAPPETPYTCSSATRLCVFPGGLGLAPRWIDHRLDRPGQNWVSACLFARVNANDTAEAVSLRGGNPGLIVSPEEAELYTAEEGAFYGNLFIDDPDPSVPPDWHACRGEAKAECPGDVGCGGLANRDCAAENPATPGYTYCGFEFAGDCGDFTPSTPSPFACRTYDAAAGTYGDCHEASGFGQWPGQRKYREVITTWVANN
jgi:hypothetical protein